MEAKAKAVPCIPGTLPGGLSRTQFFDGMFLTQKDLEREQNYWFMKRRLTNRALGTGVVWGLRLQWDSMKRKFHLSPGYALNCCGDDLVVECETEFTERSLVDLSDPLVRALMSGQQLSSDRCPKPAGEEAQRKAGIILQYMECPEEPKPVHQDACTTNVTRCEYSSIRETTRLLLVPPPQAPKPGPVDNFCTNLEALRKDCEAAGVDCNLFQADTTATQLNARIRLQEQTDPPPAGTDIRPDLNLDNQPVTNTLAVENDPATLRVWFEPDPGYVFLGGKVTDSNGVETTLSPFGVDLPDVDVGANMVTYAITDLVVASLFTKGTHQQASMTLSLSLDAANDVVTINIVTESVEAIDEPASCSDLICRGLLFDSDPVCVTKTLALNATCGWFKSLIGSIDENSMAGRQELAWLICLLSWRLMFKANLEEDAELKLKGLVQKLFAEWCSGFVYPGPRCTEEHHGVYLGCVELSKAGQIIHFDPWEYRRHVITGPLLNHWRGQLGLAPIDVVGSRLVQWICCMSDSQFMGLPQQMTSVAETYIPITDEGVGLYYGSNYAAYLESHGLTMVGDPQSLTLSEFSQMVIKSMLHTDPAVDPAALRGRRIYTVADQQQVHMLFPVSTGLIPWQERRLTEHNDLMIMVDRMTSNLRPLARHVVSDFLVEFSRDIQLNSLSVPTGNDYFQPIVTALESSGVTSVGDFLAIGPEAAVKRAMPYTAESGIEESEIAYSAAEDVFDVVETLMKKSAKPLIKMAKETTVPFVRDRLTDDTLITDIREGAATTLKRNHLTKTEVSNVAERVIAMG